MAPARAVRQRKLNKTSQQQILLQNELDAAEFSSLQNQNAVETGVEKSEEKEHHLQQALQLSTQGAEKKSIPAPPADESPDIKYDELYSLEFAKPATYIRFSQTVDECTGCQYNMTTEDDEFLKKYNQSQQARKKLKLSEDDFEKIMYLLEEEATIHAPFAMVDGTSVSFETLRNAVERELDKTLYEIAKDVYVHWAAQKLLANNGPLQPMLKIEKDPAKDDLDPYVCFRRRDGRQTRKTRNRDQQFAERLKRLRREVADGANLINMTVQREYTKRDLLGADRTIFEMRAEVKRNKIKLGIKTDDDDLLTQKPKRKVTADNTHMQRPLGPPLRVPARSDGRPPEADLIQLSDLIAQKENSIRAEIEFKAEQHRQWNINHIDLTREPLSPVSGQGPDTGYRLATAQYQYLMTPPSSVTSESFDHPSPFQEIEHIMARYNSPPEEEEEGHGQPAYRRRIGRGGRLWIDRKGMPSAVHTIDSEVNESSDRWKYDQDDDDEQPVYEVDQFNTRALMFRASIPLAQTHQSSRGQLARASVANPALNRAIGPAQSQPQQPAPT